jgi:hypothetical protein
MTKFGESKSVVLVNGMVRGTWSLEKDRLTYVCRVEWHDGHPEVPAGLVEATALDAGRFYTGGEVEVRADT